MSHRTIQQCIGIIDIGTTYIDYIVGISPYLWIPTAEKNFSTQVKKPYLESMFLCLEPRNVKIKKILIIGKNNNKIIIIGIMVFLALDSIEAGSCS